MVGNRICCAVLLLLLLFAADGRVVAQEATAGRRLHGDPAVVQEAHLAAATAFIHDDLAAAKRELERIAIHTRQLMPEENEFFGKDIVTYDKAFHTTLSMTRALLNREEADRAFEQFWYIQKACRVCHGLARDRGLLAGSGEPVAGVPEVPSDRAQRDLGDQR